MRRPRAERGGWLAAALALAACSPPAAPEREAASAPPSTPVTERPPLGLMTSLPLYWPPGDIAAIATGSGPLPWQRTAIETRYSIVPLDTLSPVPGLGEGAGEIDPLAGLERLAVIQPRGLSPADNVALDAWVRRGGRLLLVLDPALTGEYEAALGDPRRPVDTALIPPVVARWGLAITFDDAQELEVSSVQVGNLALPLAVAGRVAIAEPARADCTLSPRGAAATCRVGKGAVTLIADAAVFEHAELADEQGTALAALLAATLQ